MYIWQMSAGMGIQGSFTFCLFSLLKLLSLSLLSLHCIIPSTLLNCLQFPHDACLFYIWISCSSTSYPMSLSISGTLTPLWWSNCWILCCVNCLLTCIIQVKKVDLTSHLDLPTFLTVVLLHSNHGICDTFLDVCIVYSYQKHSKVQ